MTDQREINGLIPPKGVCSGKAYYRCVQCGQTAPELFKYYHSGIIKLSYCAGCKSIVDHYVTFDAAIIFLDALLHKPQAYRHLLFNIGLAAPWKLLIIFLLCDSYLKWDNLHSNHTSDADAHILYAALEWDFYRMFAVTVIEWLTFISIIMTCIQVLDWSQPTACVLKALTVSSFGKLLVIPAIIWGQTHSAIYLWLAQIFVLTSNISALKVVTKRGRVLLLIIVGIAWICQHWIGQWTREAFQW